ncbi:phage virion morphogenesis protein [Roseomonas sp. HJA6]|uniref:Phage virion morphogenesis protein n=1 Tax=Roseomonas alba TaxID=2846776 RepID=A0ABS7AIG2_9PROT|nr:phage virion morphogenesis protein [Neoroseomonas alba]
MNGVTLSATLDSRDAQRALAALERAGREPGMLLRPIGVVLIRGTRDRMQREVDPEGNAWEPLQPWYAAEKRNSRMLKESGRLEGSIVTEFDADTLAIGSRLPYSAVHQFGATIRPVHGPLLIFRTANGEPWGAAEEVYVPARPYLGISEADAQAVEDVVEQVMWRVARL